MERLTTLAFFLAGLALAGLGWHLLQKHNREKHCCAAQCPGTVSDIGHVVLPSKKGDVHHYRPVFAYTVAGVEYVGRPFISYKTPSVFPDGMRVTVFYDPSDPNRFYVAEQRQPPVGPLFFIVVGVAFMLGSGF